MTKLLNSAPGVGANLIQAEVASGNSVLLTAALSVAMIEASQIDRLYILEGQSALADVAEAHSLAVKSRFHLGRAHQRLAEVAQKHGIDWTAFGDEYETPKMPLVQAEPAAA